MRGGAWVATHVMVFNPVMQPIACLRRDDLPQPTRHGDDILLRAHGRMTPPLHIPSNERTVRMEEIMLRWQLVRSDDAPDCWFLMTAANPKSFDRLALPAVLLRGRYSLDDLVDRETELHG